MTLSTTKNARMLYKLILRLHRGLPEDLQILGTQYAREEFKRHKSCPPPEAAIFMKEWTNYVIRLAEQLGAKRGSSPTKFGAQLPVELIDNLRDEQIIQLHELMEASHAPKLVEQHQEG
ncbi:hypothetical protein HUJ04_013417 [Dendroctonus ponderosae]|nr:hypothetical protein HUJ04_013417 [Dendroctonus ponderosae]KAH1006229.1 hypothetical protein HUJ05_006978 [Dendroctonus ponderosae]